MMNQLKIKCREGVRDKRNCNLVSWKNYQLPSTNERTCRGGYEELPGCIPLL